MQSRMHPKYYLSHEIFEREQQKVFRKVWLFAGLASLVEKNNAFMTRTMTGIPVVVQNFGGTLHAFENVCLHRSAPLQSGFAGKRPLICPYHAWSYNEDGTVRKIPDCEKIYCFEPGYVAGLKLREFAVRRVGGLIFVNLSDDPMPIEDQFSPEFLESLTSSSDSYDSEVIVTTRHCKFNWKLIYENLRDFNHVRYLHSKTLATGVSFEGGGVDIEAAQETREELSNPSVADMRRMMRGFSYGGAEGKFESRRHFPWMDNVTRWGDTDAYFNWLPYPNLHIASGNGCYSFTLEHHIPVAPDRTDLEIYFVSARKKQPYAASSQMLLSSMYSTNVVLNEDIGMMESIQAALHEHAPMPNQGAYEFTNRQLERWYTNLMESDHEI